MKSSRKIRYLLFIALLSAAFAVSAQQEQRTFAGKHYQLHGSEWLVREADGRFFRVDDQVITVKFKPSVSATEQVMLHRALDVEVLRTAITGYVDVRTSGDLFAVLESYLANGGVESVEPNTIGEYHLIPDDAQYNQQWYPPLIGAEQAWDTTTGSSDVVIAVLDSGTEFNHADLGMGADDYQNVWLNPGEDAWSDPANPGSGNGVDDDGNGLVDDWKGWNFGDGDNDSSGSFFHGTAVAGVVAAKTNNALGVAGIGGGFGNAGLGLMIVGVGNNAPLGAVLDDAILYAAEQGARVIQLSLSVGQSGAIDAALQTAYEDFGVLIVCSSGNGGTGAVSYPSSNPFVIAVGATDQSDSKAGFSQFGTDLEIAAPGTSIRTTSLGNGYTTTQGTSFSSPIISAVAGLVWSVNPALTNEEVRTLLHMSGEQVGGYDYNHDPKRPGHSLELGFGRINVLNAVQMAGLQEVFHVDGFESLQR
ncbi:MAG: S8 family serine peptidase [Gammaproteobacteria bacterium]|nr:S8 family serine peptidase [Gammaproteobacteria bacterium]